MFKMKVCGFQSTGRSLCLNCAERIYKNGLEKYMNADDIHARRFLQTKNMNDKTQPIRNNLKSPHRLSYLLCLWRTDEPGNFHWQASLETSKTGKRICFAEIEQLFTYLMDLIEGNLKEQQNVEKE